MSRREAIVVLAAIALVVIAGGVIALKLYHAQSTRNYPPPACELFGGTWDSWNGWRCR